MACHFAPQHKRSQAARCGARRYRLISATVVAQLACHPLVTVVTVVTVMTVMTVMTAVQACTTQP